MRKCCLRELGRIDYGPALELQQQLASGRKQGLIADQLLLLEHPHVITLGRNGRMENLLAGGESHIIVRSLPILESWIVGLVRHRLAGVAAGH